MEIHLFWQCRPDYLKEALHIQTSTEELLNQDIGLERQSLLFIKLVPRESSFDMQKPTEKLPLQSNLENLLVHNQRCDFILWWRLLQSTDERMWTKTKTIGQN